MSKQATEAEPGNGKKKKATLAKYGGWDLEQTKKDRKEMSSGEFLKLEAGKNVVRFLPPLPGREAYVKTFQHFIRTPGSTAPVVFNCPLKMAKEPCPACAQSQKLMGGGKADRERAFELAPKLRVFASVIDRKNPDDGPRILAFGKMVFEGLGGILADGEDGMDFSEPGPEGRDIIIEREGTGKTDTRYKVRLSVKESPLGDMSWIESQPDLTRYARVLSLDEIKELFSGEPSRREDYEDAPAPRKRIAKAHIEDVVDTDGEEVKEDDALPY
jgi:hypothetical protein